MILSMRPTFAKIYLNNLKFNYLKLKRRVDNRKVIAVVKANAYGHGVVKAVEALESLGKDKPFYYAVALTEEAVEIRENKLTDSPILSFAPFCKDELSEYLKYSIIPTVSSIEQIEIIKKINLKEKLKIHVNVDTGMGRLGIHFSQAHEALKVLYSQGNIEVDGIYTHFATSDEKNKRFTIIQLNRFNKILAFLKANKIKPNLIHASNSGAIIDVPQAWFDAVRPGISLYGYSPSQETGEAVELKPVMELVSKITTLKRITKGETVSYGRIFTAKRETLAATVPVGYADGYNRNLSNKAYGIINGKLVKQIGRVTMDRILFDVTDVDVQVGDEVVLLGQRSKLKFDAWDWSNILNTIPYEVTCNISKRVPRIYVD